MPDEWASPSSKVPTSIGRVVVEATAPNSDEDHNDYRTMVTVLDQNGQTLQILEEELEDLLLQGQINQLRNMLEDVREAAEALLA